MNRFDLLKDRRESLIQKTADIREKINKIVDNGSFVEQSTYSFSKSDFYENGADGEGVLTGFAMIDGNPCYVVAQNAKILSGGVSKGACDKICKAIDCALGSDAPIVYILDTKGVRVGEGVTVLEGIADVLYWMNAGRGKVAQMAIVDGDCYGAFALIAAACDFTFCTKNACISYASPAVIAASSKAQLDKAAIGGVKSFAKTGVANFVVEELTEIKEKITELLDLLYCVDADNSDDYNRSSYNLNERVCPKCLIEATFDNGKFVEMGKGYADEVICGLGRIGGLTVGAVIFNGGEDGVELTPAVVDKIKEFTCFISDYNLTLVNFVNTKGISACVDVCQSTIMKDVSNLIYNIIDMPKVSVIYGKAIGLGYSIFAAKSLGYNYSYAFCNSQVSLFDSVEGAYVEFDGVKYDNEAALAEKYSLENQDPIHAAKGGFIDDVIEPQYVRQYLIASLQMIVR